jgi:hypothetical protein
MNKRDAMTPTLSMQSGRKILRRYVFGIRMGELFQAANEFGESLLHMACRRGFLDVVKFLVDEAGHNLWFATILVGRHFTMLAGQPSQFPSL